MHGTLRIFEDKGQLQAALLRLWERLAESAISDHGGFHIALTGGNTPRDIYQYFAERGQALPWAKTHIYFGDERCVPRDHEDSNYHMAHIALLADVPVPPAQVHPMFDPQYSAEENAARYAALLAENLPQEVIDGNSIPVFDLILLGMGEDGHTASLFPETPILDEGRRTVAAQFVEKLAAWRVSLTFPTLNTAQHVVVLAPGANKAEILAKVSEAETGQYPIQRLKPRGSLEWYVDQAAARLLDKTALS